MDGLKRHLKDSLQLRLSLWLTLVIVGIAVLAGMFSFVAALDEANELQDDVLRQVAALFDQQHMVLPLALDSGRTVAADAESRVFVQPLSATVGTTGQPQLALPATLPEGLQTFSVYRTPYRILVKTLASGERIAVAQQSSVRDEAARDSAERTLMPFLVLVPILLLVVAVLVRRIFRPVAALSVEIDKRSEQQLHPFAEESLPGEVRPFVVAINRLLGRISQAMDAQRRFVADAAHELRSPLTALSLQAELLADTEMTDTARERLVTLRLGIDRGRALLDQLLALARAQSGAMSPLRGVPVQQVYRRVLEDLLPLAEAKQIDLGVNGEGDAQILANEVELITLVKNLVDNAIRYTHFGGRVDLSVRSSPGQVILQITDTGPGIAMEERDRVFAPFYRLLGNDVDGSGLGLSIVQTIAQRMGARVQLGYANEGTQTGLAVQVSVPEYSKVGAGNAG